MLGTLVTAWYSSDGEGEGGASHVRICEPGDMLRAYVGGELAAKNSRYIFLPPIDQGLQAYG